MHKLFVHLLGKYVVYLHERDELDLYSLRSLHKPELYKAKGKKLTMPRKLKWTVWKRDGYQCIYCLTTNGPLSVDHVVPECQGGTMKISNLATACFRCNSHKAESSYDEFINSTWLKKRKRDIQSGLKAERNNQSSSSKGQHRSGLLGVRLSELPGTTRGSKDKLPILTEFR